MKSIKIFGFLLLSMFLLVACSANPRKGDSIVASSANSEDNKTKQPIAEPVGAAGKASWLEFQAGMQVMEKDPFSAVYYFDIALSELYAEQQQDSLRLPEDSLYFSTMPMRIIIAMESLYPKLLYLTGTRQAFSILNDYENLSSFEETQMDITEKEDIESHLDEMDQSEFSLPIEINDRVMREIHFLTANAKNFMTASLSRKTLLDSMIYAKLKARGMPADLIYLALVESGYKPSAYSSAKAAGVWQFIPSTGKRYGLTSDFWVDLRRNPELATDAALEYLSSLYSEFDDWYLAMAAYNCGEGRIRRLVKEKLAADSSLKKVSYWDLQLPKETMHYVPRIVAATIIGHYPHHYDIIVEPQKRIAYDTVTVKDCIPLEKVGGAVGASVNIIRDLNPELVRWCTPPNLKSYTMRVPQGTRETFLKAYEKMDKTQLVRWQQYKVQKGDNIGHISKLFGIKAADIQAANNLKNTKLKVGQTLIIPMPTGATAPKSEAKSTAAKATAAKSETTVAAAPAVSAASVVPAANNARTYTVRKGDNLSSIARRFGVSSQNLMTWNRLQNNKVNIGQKLYLQDPIKSVESHKKDLAKYEIKNGDSLWDIARMHNVTVQQLLDWNPGLDKNIYPGMKIRIGH
ncbi:MAG: LysM peptidoglycan-binding domain-containing protein [Fibromonadales bacterium]|nr:LysM peptidoglycan-binding domain-containing protein [Fibromonadales bacterium]